MLLHDTTRYTIMAGDEMKIGFSARPSNTEAELADILQEVVNMLRAEKREMAIEEMDEIDGRDDILVATI